MWRGRTIVGRPDREDDGELRALSRRSGRAGRSASVVRRLLAGAWRHALAPPAPPATSEVTMRSLDVPLRAVILAVALVACSEPGGADPSTPFAIHARIALVADPDGEHVSFVAQNGATVTLAKSDVVGKTVLWGTVQGGDSINNAPQIDKGVTKMAGDLTSTWVTPPHYPRGAWEVACIVSISGVPKPYTPGDLGARDDSPPPPGDPPVTGASVRVDVTDGDATLALTNRHFRRFAAP
jgi:hypothetical protein